MTVTSNLRDCKAYVRWRPLPPSETTVGEIQRQNIKHGNHTYSIQVESHESHPGRPPTWKSTASLSNIFTSETNNKAVFETVVQSTLPAVLDGAVCNFFAYGHSGSGKTHTIIGYDYENVENLGICLSTANQLFQALDDLNNDTTDRDPNRLGIGLRLYEMRRKSAFDLLNNHNECFVREGDDGRTHIRGETETLEGGKVRVRPIVTRPCWNFEQLRQELLAGLQLRATGSSTIHDQSSRTHAIVELEIINSALLEARDAVIERQSELVPVGKEATRVYIEESYKSIMQDDNGKWIPNPDRPINQAVIDEAEKLKDEFQARVDQAELHVATVLNTSKHSCLGGRYVFVDLAGAEFFTSEGTQTVRGKSSTSTAQDRQESRQINADLFALKEVIRARALRQPRIPFRSSTLTMALREHFVQSDRGYSAMILTVSPAADQYAATVNTLKYGTLVGSAGAGAGAGAAAPAKKLKT
ncbi:hypothetical protein PV10_04541 [Exophiala mesophila]|uniref:Kinesin motor domain-containing protein n=1 Tax=Exophiala mesophila TaxID=212818 RepID=A0A0D1XYI6_EXOME|nr:uncharacterized protein PV10_04541 [Exophiala mesophila]KIV93321.1 hypothetical protein PV10_04541 [Exophiala mesophila]